MRIVMYGGGIWTLKDQDKSRIRADNIFLAKQKRACLLATKKSRYPKRP